MAAKYINLNLAMDIKHYGKNESGLNEVTVCFYYKHIDMLLNDIELEDLLSTFRGNYDDNFFCYEIT